MSTALKAIQDKLAIEANDFQALQKGERAAGPPPPTRRKRLEQGCPLEKGFLLSVDVLTHPLLSLLSL